MPGMNGQGPMGQGPMTGWGRGRCGGGLGNGGRRMRGGCGRGRGWCRDVACAAPDVGTQRRIRLEGRLAGLRDEIADVERALAAPEPAAP